MIETSATHCQMANGTNYCLTHLVVDVDPPLSLRLLHWIPQGGARKLVLVVSILLVGPGPRWEGQL